MVRGLCRLLLRDGTEAEDASQQTFLSAYRALLGGAEPREPAAWLATIARNECRARVHARMRAPVTVTAAPAPALQDPLEDAIRRFDLRAVLAAITSLPERQRQALLLRELGGLSYDELAVALGVSIPAVESLLVRARAALRSALRPAQTLVPSFGRLISWPVVAKVAATTVGASLVAGSTMAVSRHDGGPTKADPAPAAVDRPAAHPIARRAAAAPQFAAPVTNRVSERSEAEREQSPEHDGTVEEQAASAPERTAESHEDGKSGPNVTTEAVLSAETGDLGVVGDTGATDGADAGGD